MTQQEQLTKFRKVLAENLGKPVEVVDPTNRNQCFDWSVKVCLAYGLPISIFAGLLNASQIWTNPTSLSKQVFDFIPNTATAVTEEGDIVVFAGIPGHVSVASKKGTLTNFESSDQNWAGKQYVVLVNHNYDNPKVLGFLRLKTTITSSQTNMPTPQQVREAGQLEQILNALVDAQKLSSRAVEDYLDNGGILGSVKNLLKENSDLKAQGGSAKIKSDILALLAKY